jgi:Putative cyclase
VYYGGRRGPEIAETWGTSKLGSEHTGPIVTRGVLLDVLGLKLVQDATDVLETAPNGRPHLAATYLITLDDLEAAMRRAGIKRIKRGDAVLIRTGWNQLLEPHDPTSPHEPDDPGSSRSSGSPEVLDDRAGDLPPRGSLARLPSSRHRGRGQLGGRGSRQPRCGDQCLPRPPGAAHHFGIRIGEAIVTDRLAEDRVFEFVYIVTPQYAVGATAGNTPPCALGQPRR